MYLYKRPTVSNPTNPDQAGLPSRLLNLGDDALFWVTGLGVVLAITYTVCGFTKVGVLFLVLGPVCVVGRFIIKTVVALLKSR